MREATLQRAFANRFLPLVLAAAGLISVSIPSTYYLLAQRDLRTQATIYAEQIANVIRRSVENNPAVWRYDHHLFDPVYQDYLSHRGIDRLAVLDEQGRVISSSGEAHEGADVMSSHDLVYNNRVIGRVQVSISGKQVMRQTVGLFAVALGLGGTIGLGLFLWPLRVIGRAERALVAQIKSEAEAVYLAERERQRSGELTSANAELETANRRATILTRELAQKNRELETFLFSASHDLKTPLVSIHGFIGVIAECDGARLGEDSRRALDRVIANVTQMQHLIEDLLNLARIGRQERQIELVEVGQMVEGIVENCRVRMPNRQVAVTLETLPALETDRRCLQQVLENLINNAFKFLGEQAAPAIRVAAYDEGDVVRFLVEDNGIGIAPEYHDKVFGLFQRLGEVAVDGTGVGLAIVKRIIEDAGGAVQIRSERGHGSTFSFTWPKNSRGHMPLRLAA